MAAAAQTVRRQSRWPLPDWLTVTLGAILAVAVAVLAIYYGLAPHVTLHDRPLSWVEWAELGGVALGLMALLVTMIQVARAKTAADSARDAVDRALEALNRNELLVDLQSLRQLEYDFDEAVEQKDEGAVKRLLRDWRDTGARVTSALLQANPDDPLVGAIESTRESASQAKVVMISGQRSVNVGRITKKFREEIAPVGNQLSSRMSNLRLEIGRQDDV
jgi:hypothetical protein